MYNYIYTLISLWLVHSTDAVVVINDGDDEDEYSYIEYVTTCNLHSASHIWVSDSLSQSLRHFLYKCIEETSIEAMNFTSCVKARAIIIDCFYLSNEHSDSFIKLKIVN